MVLEPLLPSSPIVNPNLRAAAWPHNVYVSPLNIQPLWTNSTDDAAAYTIVREAEKMLRAQVEQDGGDPDVPLYPVSRFSLEW